MPRISRALISVSDKIGIEEFARALQKRGVELVSTGGTAAMLKAAGVPVVDVSSYTGSPEILGGRLKTLHPKIHGGILGRRGDPRHIDEMKAAGIGPIDMVVCNLYPFEATVARRDSTLEEAIENIDIGGPTMLRSAAKNHEDVAVVVDPADYKLIVDEMDTRGGDLSGETTFRLAKKAFALTARYDCAIMNYLCQLSDTKDQLGHPTDIGFTFTLSQKLRYGENPHQKAAFYRDTVLPQEPCLVSAKQIQGKELSFNNIMDADAAIEMVKEFVDARHACVIVKHANPCGAAVSEITLADAYSKALSCDPTSAFGGIIAVNREIDENLASAVAETFYEVIAAPSFTSGTLDVFSKKKNLRLLEVAGLGQPFPPSGFSFRRVVGGLLLQDRDTSREDVRVSKIVTRRKPTDEEWAALEFAWPVSKHVKSNAVIYATVDRTLGIGAGQMSRIDSAKIAAMKMKSILNSSSLHASRFTSPVIVVASDAFFPFRDGIDAVHEVGATAIVQPGGSLRDEEVIAAADEHNMAMVFTGVRHFRH